MMENRIDKRGVSHKIGKEEAYINVGIALGIDALLIAWMVVEDDYNWILEQDYWWKMILAAIVFVLVAQWIGKKCAQAIIVKELAWFLLGPIYALLIFIVTVFVSGFLSACLDWEHWHDFPANFIMDAVAAPLLMIIYSCIPITIHGLFFGYRIYRKGKKRVP